MVTLFIRDRLNVDIAAKHSQHFLNRKCTVRGVENMKMNMNEQSLKRFTQSRHECNDMSEGITRVIPFQENVGVIEWR